MLRAYILQLIIQGMNHDLKTDLLVNNYQEVMYVLEKFSNQSESSIQQCHGINS